MPRPYHWLATATAGHDIEPLLAMPNLTLRTLHLALGAALIVLPGHSPLPAHADEPVPSTAPAPAPTTFLGGVFKGRLDYAGQRMPIELNTDADASRVNVIPGWRMPASRCAPRGWRGVNETTGFFNEIKLRVQADGRFVGDGHVNERPLESDGTIALWARWHVRGRFTSPTRARGTLRIAGGLRARENRRKAPPGKILLRCPAITVKWQATRTGAGSDGAARG